MQTNSEIEASEDTAIIVFCGLSEMYGFDAEDTASHLAIEEWEYYRDLKQYRKKMDEAAKRLADNKWNIEINDLVQKVWIKSRLIQNRVDLCYRSRLNITDLPCL